MPALLELQRQLHERLIADTETPVPSWLHAGTGDAAERLDIYRATVQDTLVRALRLAFPTVHRLVGNEFFEGAGRIFAQEHRPTSADLNNYGSDFPPFIEQFGPCAALEYLPDVARLDWAVAHALYAPDKDPLELAAFVAAVGVDPTRLRFAAHPSVSLLRSRFPVDAIWRAVLAQDEAAMGAVDLASGPAHLIVERLGASVSVHRLSAAEWRLSRGLLQGMPVAELLGKPIPDLDVPALLAEHFNAGRLVALSSDETREAAP